MLSLFRSLKNTFVPINRIPPEVLSLIPDHYNTDYADRVSITLTHVSRGWREIFISRSSLWTRLGFKSADKTRTYLQRSKTSPLHVCVNSTHEAYPNHTLSLVTPHLSRLRSLIISADTIPDILRHFRCHAPLLERLDVKNTSPHAQMLNTSLFGGDLSPLRSLRLAGVTTRLPWTNMTNLTVFDLSCPPGHKVTVTQFLNFFQSAPLLYTVRIANSIPASSDAPPGRIVSLRHLHTLAITASPVHSILNHLYVPTGASLRVCTTFGGEVSPLIHYLPETSPNIRNLSHVTAINLCIKPNAKCLKLSGPSGSFRLFAHTAPLPNADHRILSSLSPRMLSAIQWLSVSDYMHRNSTNLEQWPIFHTLLSTNNLRTLVLSQCDNQPFTSVLNPEENPSKLLLCPNLKEITLYETAWPPAEGLINMAKGRASSEAKLSLMTIIISADISPSEIGLLILRKHVTQVECKVGVTRPAWDDLPDESVGGH